MELAIHTLTPLWTGGAEAGKVDRLHETGILGSLRWWMEALVRGMGGKACDPNQGECRLDAEKYEKSRAADEHQRLRDTGLCDVCQVFGATGWRRRFRLHIVEKKVSDARIEHTVSLSNRQYTDDQGKQRTPIWYFRDPTQSDQSKPKPSTPKQGLFNIEIQSLDSHFSAEIIAGLVQFVANWAALGARAQMGFGVIEPVNGRIETQALYNWLIARTGSETYSELPSLQNIFLAKIRPKDPNSPFTEQSPFTLKYDLRQLYANDQELRHFIMGTVKGERIAAKVKMSRPYGGGLIRVWGWIPEKATVDQDSWDRDAVVKAIHQHLEANYSLQVWREMNSPRDTATPNIRDAKVFLRSLLS